MPWVNANHFGVNFTYPKMIISNEAAFIACLIFPPKANKAKPNSLLHR